MRNIYMRKLALLSVLLLLAVSLFAQTPAVPRVAVWQITPTVSVQYDPTVWKLGTMDNSQVLLLMGKDKAPRSDVALNVTIIPTSDKMGAADVIASRVAKTQGEKGVTQLALKEYQAGAEYGVLFAYTASDKDGKDYVIGRWSFAGDKLDIRSQSVIEFEGVIPIAASNDDILPQMDAVIKTYQIK